MYSQAFDHVHGSYDEDAVYTDPDSLQEEVDEHLLIQRRSRGRGTGFRKKQSNPQFDLSDDMGQSHTSEYIDVFEVNPRQTSHQRQQRSRSDGQILQDRQRFEHAYREQCVSLAGHTNEESTDYCYAVEPPNKDNPELRKKPPVAQRSVSVKDDYSQPPDRLSKPRGVSQDYTEPYQSCSTDKKSPKKNHSEPPDTNIYEFAKEPLCHEFEDNTYNHINTAGSKSTEFASSYDHITLQRQGPNIEDSEYSQAKDISPTRKHPAMPKTKPPQSSAGSAAKAQPCQYSDIPPNYEEPWDSQAGQRKLSRLLEKAEKKDERRQSLDKQSGKNDQAIAQDVQRKAGSRNPSCTEETINENSEPTACEPSELYETSWGPNVKRNSLEKKQNGASDTAVKAKTTSVNDAVTKPKINNAPPPNKHAPIPANYEDAWDLPEKQKEFEEKLEQARKQRTSKGQIRDDEAGTETQQEKVKPPESRFPAELTQPPVLPAPRIRPVPAQRDSYKRSDSCRSLGALAEKIDVSIPLQDQIFYHGAIKRSNAEKMLLVFKEGSYLIRRSETSKKDFSLTLKGWNGMPMHMKIVSNDDGSYVLGENSPPFYTIPEMIHYYTTHELPVQNAERICLLYPIPS